MLYFDASDNEFSVEMLMAASISTFDKQIAFLSAFPRRILQKDTGLKASKGCSQRAHGIFHDLLYKNACGWKSAFQLIFRKLMELSKINRSFDQKSYFLVQKEFLQQLLAVRSFLNNLYFILERRMYTLDSKCFVSTGTSILTSQLCLENIQYINWKHGHLDELVLRMCIR